MVTKADVVIGAWFRECRELGFMTQREVGMLLGVRRETVSTIESGARRLKVAELGFLLAVGFCDDVSAGDLVLNRIAKAARSGVGAREVLGD